MKIFHQLFQLNRSPQSYFPYFLYFFPVVLFFYTNCTDVVEDPDPPLPPVLVEKSQPEAWIEKGIDADNSGNDRIVIMWHPNLEDDLAGYRLYRADTTIENKFIKIAGINLIQNTGVDTVYYDDSLRLYVEYFYFILAIDYAGNKSVPSDTVSYRLLDSPAPNSPVNEIVQSDLTFEWMDRSSHMDYYTNQYVIRLDDVTNINQIHTVWICRFYNVWYGWENERIIPFPYFTAGNPVETWPENVISCDGVLTALPAGLYRWKVKTIHSVDNNTQIDLDSGESEWAFFSVE